MRGLLAGLPPSVTAAAQAARPPFDGDEIDAASADARGGATIVLQRRSSARPCPCVPRQTCEKMN